MKVRLFKPSVGEEELENIKGVFERAWMGLGPLVGEFEQEWSQYIGSRNSIGVNSGTAALHLALTAYGFKPGSKVLVPALTFVASATAPLYNQLEPVFVDACPDTLSMDLDDLERKITPDTVAILPVHLGGYPVDMEHVLALAKQHHLAVIEDCAHAAGGSYQGKKLGTWGDIGCFSFEEKKNMTTGDGGMICSDDTELIDPLRAYRWIGIDKDTWRRKAGYTAPNDGDPRHWHYEVSVLGYKYNMNDLMAAIGLAQLKKLDRMNQRRSEIIQRYLRGIQDLEQIKPLMPYRFDGPVYWLFGVRCARRDDLILHLKAREIATGVHFMPMPMHPLFHGHEEPVPVATEVWESMVTLPLFADMTDEEVDYVIEGLRDFDRNA